RALASRGWRVTSGGHRAPITACTLPPALVCACPIAITAAALTRQLPIAYATTRPTAHALGRDRRDRRHEHPTALGTSTAHARESAPSAGARPGWVTIPPPHPT